MGRGPHSSGAPEDLHLALRWLRHRRHLSQGEVAERAAARGEPVSLSYLKQVELARRRPGPRVLAAMLAALDSDERELQALLAAAPWRVEPPGRARAGRLTPKPADYVVAAERALAVEGGWSSPVADALAAGAGPGPARGAQPDPDLAAEVGELAALYARAPRAAQLDLLSRARRAGRGD